MTPPDWREQREVTLKVDGFTLGAAFLVAPVAGFGLGEDEFSRGE